MNINFLIKVFNKYGYKRCFNTELNLKKHTSYKTFDKSLAFCNEKIRTYFIVTIDNKENNHQLAISLPMLNYSVYVDEINELFSKLENKMRCPKKMLKKNLLYFFENI